MKGGRAYLSGILSTQRREVQRHAAASLCLLPQWPSFAKIVLETQLRSQVASRWLRPPPCQTPPRRWQQSDTASAGTLMRSSGFAPSASFESALLSTRAEYCRCQASRMPRINNCSAHPAAERAAATCVPASGPSDSVKRMASNSEAIKLIRRDRTFVSANC